MLSRCLVGPGGQIAKDFVARRANCRICVLRLRPIPVEWKGMGGARDIQPVELRARLLRNRGLGVASCGVVAE